MKSRLGGALVVAAVADATLQPGVRLNELAKVEPLLLESEEQLQNDPVVHPNWKRDAIERLVRLYEVWNGVATNTGKAEKVAEWNKKLAEFDKAEAGKKTAASKP